jgi:hypothetical protein
MGVHVIDDSHDFRGRILSEAKADSGQSRA